MSVNLIILATPRVRKNPICSSGKITMEQREGGVMEKAWKLEENLTKTSSQISALNGLNLSISRLLSS